MQTLGQVLRERREAIGLSRSAVARRVEVSDSYISMVERAIPQRGGRPSQPSVDVLSRWFAALGWGQASAEDRRYIDRLLALAGHAGPDEQPDLGLPFGGASALHYPQPRRLRRQIEAEQALEEIGRKLDEVAVRPDVDDERWAEFQALLHSFVEWLDFRLGEKG